MSEYIITTKQGKNAYRLTPLGNRSQHTLCYDLQYWRDGYTDPDGNEFKSMWKPSGKFPVTIAHGFRLIAEDIERNGSWKLFAKANLASLMKVADHLEKVLSEFKIEEVKKTDAK